MPEAAGPDAAVETTLLGGRLRLLQPQTGHRAGSDAMLLQALIGEASGLLADIGAGCGAAGLAVALRNPALRLLLVEREPVLAGLAVRNGALNALAERTQVAQADVLNAKARAAAGIAANSADVLITNPPYLEAAQTRTSPDPLRASAHPFDQPDGLERWLRACASILKPSGTFAMIHRADALKSVLEACEGRFGALEIRPVHSYADAPAIRILVRARKGSRAPLQLLPALVVHGPDGAFTDEAAELHGV